MTRRTDGLPGYHPLSGRPAEAERQSAIQREVAAAKARAAGTPSPVPDAPEPVPPAPGPAVIRPAGALKGAMKVEAFPDRSKYPFREIADDGGVWRIDPAAYGAQPVSIRAAASKWGQEHGLKARTVLDEDMVFVQFSKAAE